MLLNITTRTHVSLIDTADNHRAIVDAILAKNARRAADLIIEHIDDAWRRARLTLESTDRSRNEGQKASRHL